MICGWVDLQPSFPRYPHSNVTHSFYFPHIYRVPLCMLKRYVRASGRREVFSSRANQPLACVMASPQGAIPCGILQLTPAQRDATPILAFNGLYTCAHRTSKHRMFHGSAEQPFFLLLAGEKKSARGAGLISPIHAVVTPTHTHTHKVWGRLARQKPKAQQ